VRAEDVRGQFALGPDAEPYVEAVQKYADAGFDHIVLQNAGPTRTASSTSSPRTCTTSCPR
jgi:hypothetical protein